MITRKRRTRGHVIADLAINHVERHVLLRGHVVERVFHDYGYDLWLFSFGDNGDAEPGAIGLQVKATEKSISLNSKYCLVRVERSDIAHWLSERRPVVVVIYNVTGDIASYIDIQDYFSQSDAPNIFALPKSVSLRIPRDQVFDAEAVRKLVHRKNELLGRGMNNAHI